MSSMYEMQVTIFGHNPEKVEEIEKAANEEWPFDLFEQAADDEAERTALWGSGQGSLSGGESDSEFTTRLSKAVWKANGKFCTVQVHAIYLESLPFEEHELGEEEYNQMMSAESEQKE